MGREYTYFAASLPALSFEGDCSQMSEEFLGSCQRLLTHEDYALMERILAEDGSEIKTHNDTLRNIIDHNRHFRNALVWFRAVRAAKDSLDFIRGEKFNHPFWADVALQASKKTNLLEGKKLIDKARWSALDDLVVGHFFDLEYLVVYGIKLKIIERYQGIRSEEGNKKFEELKTLDLMELIEQK